MEARPGCLGQVCPRLVPRGFGTKEDAYPGGICTDMENLGHGRGVPDLSFGHQKGNDAGPVERIKEMSPLMTRPMAPFGGGPLAEEEDSSTGFRDGVTPSLQTSTHGYDLQRILGVTQNFPQQHIQSFARAALAARDSHTNCDPL